MYCPSCGAANEDANKFCLACGTPLPYAPLKVAVASKVASLAPEISTLNNRCPNCGRTYHATLRFCEADGTPLVAASALPASIPKVSAPLSGLAQLPRQSTPFPMPDPDTLQDGLTEGRIFCPTCGLSFPDGTKFCEQDGTRLSGEGSAMAGQTFTTFESHDPPSDNDDFYEEHWEAPRRRLFAFGLASFVAITIIGGAGYAYWSGLADHWISRGNDPELIGVEAKPASKANAAMVVPGLSGQYGAHLLDQDITLSIDGDTPRPLVSSAGEISYRNTVNGATCTASLEPVKGGGVGGDTGNAVSFKQSAVPGKNACPADIPVKIDITGKPADAGGIVSSVSVEWNSADGERKLMSGTLVHSTPR